jgi:hypothetical protein
MTLARVPPIVTVLVAVVVPNPVPLIVTEVAPAVGPEDGSIKLTVGGAM